MVEVRWTLASDACKALALYYAPDDGPALRFHTLEPGRSQDARCSNTQLH